LSGAGLPEVRPTGTGPTERASPASRRPRRWGANVSGARFPHILRVFHQPRSPGAPAHRAFRSLAWCSRRLAPRAACRPSPQHLRKWLPGPVGSAVPPTARERW